MWGSIPVRVLGSFRCSWLTLGTLWAHSHWLGIFWRVLCVAEKILGSLVGISGLDNVAWRWKRNDGSTRSLGSLNFLGLGWFLWTQEDSILWLVGSLTEVGEASPTWWIDGFGSCISWVAGRRGVIQHGGESSWRPLAHGISLVITTCSIGDGAITPSLSQRGILEDLLIGKMVNVSAGCTGVSHTITSVNWRKARRLCSLRSRGQSVVGSWPSKSGAGSAFSGGHPDTNWCLRFDRAWLGLCRKHKRLIKFLQPPVSRRTINNSLSLRSTRLTKRGPSWLSCNCRFVVPCVRWASRLVVWSLQVALIVGQRLIVSVISHVLCVRHRWIAKPCQMES